MGRRRRQVRSRGAQELPCGCPLVQAQDLRPRRRCWPTRAGQSVAPPQQRCRAARRVTASQHAVVTDGRSVQERFGPSGWAGGEGADWNDVLMHPKDGTLPHSNAAGCPSHLLPPRHVEAARRSLELPTISPLQAMGARARAARCAHKHVFARSCWPLLLGDMITSLLWSGRFPV